MAKRLQFNSSFTPDGASPKQKKELQRASDPWSRFNHCKHQIVRPRDLPSILGISRTTCWRLSKDPESGFPKRIRLTSGCVGYYLNQLLEWLETRQVLD